MNKNITNSKLFDAWNILSITSVSNGAYLAICNTLSNCQSKVVMKIYPEQNKRPFLYELKNLCYIKSLPYIVPIIDFGLCDGLYYIIMPYLGIVGKKYSLREYIDNSPIDLQKNTVLLYRILLNLCNIKKHYPNFVHGDIKAENFLFMDSLEQVFVADFGISKIVNEPIEGLFFDSTYSYKAPELWLDNKAYSEKSDIYALGILMFELLLKRHPISNNRSLGAEEWCSLHQKGLKSLEICNLSSELDSIILSCLQKNPQNRPTLQQLTSSISELLDSSTKGNIRFGFDTNAKMRFFADILILSDDLAIKKLISMGEAKMAYEIIRNKGIPIETYNTHLALGIYYDEINDGNKSFEHLLCAMNKAISKDDLIWAINNIALIYKHADEYEISRTIFHDLLSLVSENDANNIILNIALTYSDEGNYSKAILLLNNVLKMNPDNYLIWYNLFILYRRIGDKRNAKYAYARLKMIKSEFETS